MQSVEDLRTNMITVKMKMMMVMMSMRKMLDHLLDPVHPGHQGGGVVCQAHGEGAMGALMIIMIMLIIIINVDNEDGIGEIVDDDNKYTCLLLHVSGTK